MRILSPLLAALVLAACASAPEPIPGPRPETQARLHPEVARYLPLAVGNRWTYRSRLGGREDEHTVRIVSREGGFFRDDQRGELAFDGEGIRDRRRYLILGPVEEGRTWESLLESGQRERYEIVATDASVKVPAGRFGDVLVIRGITPVQPGTRLEVEWSYAPGVGLIRLRSELRTRDAEPVPQAELELVSFELAP